MLTLRQNYLNGIDAFQVVLVGQTIRNSNTLMNRTNSFIHFQRVLARILSFELVEAR